MEGGASSTTCTATSQIPADEIAPFTQKRAISAVSIKEKKKCNDRQQLLHHSKHSNCPSFGRVLGEREMENDEKVRNEAMQLIGQHQSLPRLVVLDLDYTLWPLYCECCYDDDTPYMYPHARGIIDALKEKGIDVAVASRSPTPDFAKAFLTKLGIHDIFVAQEIFSSWTHKTEHFERIHRKTGLPYTSMLFFDDENRNIQAVFKMGVTCIYVSNGVTLEALRRGLSEFARKSSSSSRSSGE